MKNHLNAHGISRHLLNLALAASLALPLPSLAASVTLASSPLANSSTSTVSPNMMFMLDDSGSMNWDYMPDDAKNFSGYYGFESPHCNGVYYNPAFTYVPPVTSTGTSYPNSSFTNAWNDGYNQSTAGTTNLNTSFPGGSGTGQSGAPNYSGPAFYYNYSGTQTLPSQMLYHNSSSIFYQECISPIGSTTKVDGTNPVNTVFTQVNLATTPISIITVTPPPGATITVSGTNTTSVSKVIVNGIELISGTTSSSRNSTTLAGYIATAINGCTTTKTGNCTTTGGTGVSAVASGNVVTLYGNGTLGGYSPAVTNSATGGMTYSYTAFPTINPTYVSGITVNGVGISTSTATTQSAATLAAAIASSIYSPRSATVSGNVVTVTGVAADSLATPVVNTVTTGTGAGLTVTATPFPDSKPADLQNFANWYSYYSTRMLMMKTGVGLAFAPIGSNYRVGFMTMNNNVSPDFVDIHTFNAAQKLAWYNKLYASVAGNSTPLREALSHVGQLYAHKIGAYTTYTSTVTVGGSGSTVVNDISVNGVAIMAGTTAPSSSTSTVATNVALQINIPVVSNYGATSSGNVITITSGLASDVGTTPVVTDDGGGMTFTATPFVANTVTTGLNGVIPADPIQFSCQQNFVILSTDGYWNGSTDYDLDNNPVGNQDGTAPRPMYDGGLFTTTTSQTFQKQTQLTQTTSQIQKRTTQIQASTSNLQSTTYPLQSSTSNLQKSVYPLQSSTSNLQKLVYPLQSSTSNLQQSTMYLYKNTGYGWSAATSCKWSGSTSCRYGKSSSSSTTWTSSNATWTNAPSGCTVSYSTDTSNGTTWSGNGTNCQYSAYSTPATASSCTYQSQSTASPYTVGTATQCSYGTTPTATTVTTCTPVAQTTSTADGTVWNAAAYSCGYGPYSTPATASSCTYQNQSTAAPYAGPAVTCSYGSTPTVTNVTTCTPIAQTTSTANGTVWNAAAPSCGYSGWSAYANAGSCTPLAQSAASPYTVGTATQCQTTDTGWVGAASCTNSGPTNGLTVSCPSPNPVVTGPTPVLSCTPQTASSSNNYVTISCTTNTIQNSTAVGTCTQGNTGSPDYINTTCTTTTLSTSTNAASCTPGNSGPPSYITTTCTSGSGGTSNTLADVAMYYYQTDLRDPSLSNCTGAPSTQYPSGTNVCPNNVFVTPQDTNTQQHLTTYTLGIGTRGSMVYTSPNYMSDTSGDFYSVRTGAKANSAASPPVCSWQANGTVCNWPIPASNSYTNIDDLWHAAVDGHGTYYNASNPQGLSNGLTSALSSITARKGAAAAAATSTLNPVAGNNFAYVASYTTVQWTGNLESRSINTNTGVIAQSATWCVENIAADTCLAPGTVVASNSGNSTIYNCVTPGATSSSCASPGVFDSTANTCSVQMALSCNGTMPNLVAPFSDARTIYTANSTGTGLINFDSTYATANPASFSAAHISSLSQWVGLTPAQQALAPGVNLINYLRGQTGYDNRSSNPVANQIYRARLATLGDALESQPAYIGAPTFSYADAGYSAFITANASRPGMVYMGTNDGMLHAFAASTGVESWAYVPSMVIPNMWKLADFSYGTQHANYVNGSPIISDFYCTSNCGGTGGAASWRTILVGGLNGGGRGYYALDVTVPSAPTLLWEFTPAQDADLGYTYGLPVVTKLANGTWVVLVTSGYDNGTTSGDGTTANSPAGSGVGYLYVLDARTGAIIKKISTGVGSAGTPSGLAKIAAWNNAPSSNQASYVYGGDLLGNVWRFDINAGTAFLFATLRDASGNPQPVTTTPALGQILGQRVVFVGTGEYLQIPDLTNTNVQSLYAISDNNATATLVNPRSYTATSPKMVQQTITLNGTIRTGSLNAVDFSADRGWFVDFPDTGERVNIDPTLVLGTLLVPTIVPSNTVCSPGGYGWLNYFDYSTGQPVTGNSGTGGTTTAVNTNVSVQYQASIVGINVLYIAGAPVVEVVTSNNPTPTLPSSPVPFTLPTSTFTGIRMLWRELTP